MEDLSGLEKLQPNFLLNLLFRGIDKGFDRKIAIYRKVIVRLIDKATDEYNEARNLIVSQILEGQQTDEVKTKNGRVIYMIKFVDHMENLIGTLRRILRLFEKLKSNTQGFSFPREIRRQIESLATPLVQLRNTIEHLDDAVLKDEIGETEAVMIKIKEDQSGIEIGSNSISFFELSTLIKKLHGLGQILVGWELGSNSTRTSEK